MEGYIFYVFFAMKYFQVLLKTPSSIKQYLKNTNYINNIKIFTQYNINININQDLVLKTKYNNVPPYI